MLDTLGRGTFDEKTIHGWVGNGAQMLVWRALSRDRETDSSIPKAEIDHALKIFLEIYESNLCVATQPYDGVVKTLHTLKEEGYTLAIVTNKPYKFVTPILEKLGMHGLFQSILGGDSLEKKKPDPLPLEYVCKTFNIPIENTLMVGDSKNDILAANACGMESVGVTYGYNYDEDIGIHKPTVIINSFKDLTQYL